MIEVIKDEDLINHVGEYDIILVPTSIHCTMRHGFQHDVMIDYPYTQERNDKTKYGDLKKLGTILECKGGEGEPFFVLLYVCENYPKTKHKDEYQDYLNYDAVRDCLCLVNTLYKGQRVACPMIGCSRFDGFGDKDKVMGIINEEIKDVDLYVYDYYQLSRDEKIFEMYQKEREAKARDKSEYWRIRAARKELGKKRKEKNKHLKY